VFYIPQGELPAFRAVNQETSADAPRIKASKVQPVKDLGVAMFMHEAENMMEIWLVISSHLRKICASQIGTNSPNSKKNRIFSSHHLDIVESEILQNLLI